MRVHVLVSGLVQGVGFRQYVKYKSRKLNVNGWVRNLPTGEVEAVFDGDRKNIEKIIRVCQRGPLIAKVDNVIVNWNYPNDIDIIDFKVIKQ